MVATSLSNTVIQGIVKTLAPDLNIMEVEHVGRTLGKGAFGHVVQLRCKGFPYMLAGKCLKDDLVDDSQRALNIFCKEYGALTKLPRHDNVVQYCGICWLPNSIFPVVLMEELCSNLEQYVLGKTYLPVKQIIEILSGIVRGLDFLHSNGIIHRDLSARNVLMSTEATPKISDFGNCCFVDSQSTLSCLRSRTGLVGTPYYRAPEIEGEISHYNVQVDIFSFGHLALFTSTQTLMTSLPPIVGFDQQHQRIIRSQVERRSQYIESLPPDFPLAKLICDCLADNPSVRPTVDTVNKELNKLLSNCN